MLIATLQGMKTERVESNNCCIGFHSISTFCPSPNFLLLCAAGGDVQRKHELPEVNRAAPVQTVKRCLRKLNYSNKNPSITFVIVVLINS